MEVTYEYPVKCFLAQSVSSCVKHRDFVELQFLSFTRYGNSVSFTVQITQRCITSIKLEAKLSLDRTASQQTIYSN